MTNGPQVSGTERCHATAVGHSRIDEEERFPANDVAEILNEVSRSLAGELDLQKLVQSVTDAGTKLTGAKFGAFFYNSVNEQGESYLLYTLSGAPREAFERFGIPRKTLMFGPTFAGQGVIRCDDVTQDPRYGRSPPHHGMPKGHLPVRSYLAVPVVARSGEVIGGLFFGHPEAGVFTNAAERLAGGIAAQAAVAIENARLYEQAQREIAERKRTEQALRESEERLRLALAAGRMGTWDWNIATDEVTWSPELEAIHGLPPGTFERNFAAYRKDIHPEDRDRILGQIARTLESGEDHYIEYRIVRPDGSVRWVEGRGKLFRDGSGAASRMVGLCMDVTERKQAEQALHRSEERYRRTLALMPAAVYTCDASGLITYYNDRAVQLWGRAPQIGDADERFCGSEQMVLPDGTALPHKQCPMAIALREGRSFRNAEVNIRRPDGSLVTVLVNIDPIRNDDGEVVGAINAFHDVSAVKRAEQALRESEARLRLSQQVANIGTFDWNLQTGVNTWSPELEKLYGLKVGEFGRTQPAFERLVHPDDLAKVRERVAQSFASGDATEAEWRIIWPDGRIRWIQGHWQVFKDEAGRPLRAVGVNIDITERKHAETMQQMLLNELNHRVKNTLANVQAIAQQTLAHTRDRAEFVASFRGRLRSLARVHAMLSSTSWQGADLRELINDQLLSGPVDDKQLIVRGPKLRLEAQTALHLGLVLHELGTNSCKYGALSVPSGSVTVSWATDDALHIQWVERGGPPVAAPSKRGFGIKLIEQSAKAQGGDAKMVCQAEGVSWTINLPLREPGGSETAPSGPEALPTLSEAPADSDGRLSLAGRRFLVVEDEPLIGLDIVACLEEAQAEVTGPIGTVEQAIATAEGITLDGALLDANLGGRPVDQIASALTRRNVPFIFITGYGSDSLPPAFRGVTMLSKPFSRQQVLDVAAQLVAKRSGVVAMRR